MGLVSGGEGQREGWDCARRRKRTSKKTNVKRPIRKTL
jgi:hypothetical protein